MALEAVAVVVVLHCFMYVAAVVALFVLLLPTASPSDAVHQAFVYFSFSVTLT